MSDRTYAKVQAQQKTLSGSSPRSSLLQRTCACGQHTIAGAQCSTCRSEQSTLHRSQRAFEPPSAPGAVPGSSPAQENVPSFNSTFYRASRFGHDFSNIPIHSSHPPVLQTKLKINQPGDIYEQEADQVAEQVMRMPEPQLQRACACGGACPKCQTEQPGQEHDCVQAKRVGSGDLGQTAVPPIVHEVLRSPGQSLDPAACAFMEPRFRHDFGHVRVHTDERAGASALAVNALAYTAGHHLVFGAGQYSPTTASGRRLLAHELAHCVQQGFAANPLPRLVGDASNALERQADEAADDIYLKADKSPGDKCRNVLTQRWGCDTACSRAGFVDHETPFTDEHGEKGKSGEGCCNKWPPFVESFAIHQLSLNGAASCKGGMYKKIFKVKFKEQEIRIACTDSTTSKADHDLELSPSAATDLFGSVEFPLNTQVEVCPDGDLPNLCEPDEKALNNPNNPSFPRQRDCVEKGCIPQDNSVDCSRYGWPKK